MMILAPRPRAELPTDALLARVRGRRSRLDPGDRVGDGSAETPETDLMAAFDWVYLRLQRKLLRRLAPYFELVAMRRLVTGLRYRLAREDVPRPLLRSRLLDPELLSLLERAAEPAKLVERLEHLLADAYPFTEGLAGVYLRQGPGGLEQVLVAGILHQGLEQARDPAVRLTLGYLVDMRNILAILKQWRWRVSTPPELLSGGRFSASYLLRTWKSGEGSAMVRLAERLAGRSVQGEAPGSVERMLLIGLSQQLRRYGRDPLGAGVVLDYLWRCQVQARNRALRLALGEDREPLLAESLLV